MKKCGTGFQPVIPLALSLILAGIKPVCTGWKSVPHVCVSLLQRAGRRRLKKRSTDQCIAALSAMRSLRSRLAVMHEESESTAAPLDPSLQRYSRQILFDKIGAEGQRRLSSARVTLIGCGALGTVLANTLVRGGVGYLRICDRDYIERDNLQRQVLFDEADIAANLPKSEAAARKLMGINSDVTIEAEVTDVTHRNIERLAAGADLILDGTDNFETRYLINDYCVKTDTPWVYGAVIGSTGLCMTIIPHDTPCLRCVFENAPPADMNPTCDTAGVLAATVNIVASLQAIEAVKLLIGRRDEINRHLVHADVWSSRFVNMNVQSTYDEGDCPCCKRGEFPYLSGQRAAQATTLCGRDAVQISAEHTASPNLEALARSLQRAGVGRISHNKFLLRAEVGGYELTLFADGRAIIKGTDDPKKARTLYAKYFGA